jgi:Family of unknown function (DUF6113)
MSYGPDLIVAPTPLWGRLLARVATLLCGVWMGILSLMFHQNWLTFGLALLACIALMGWVISTKLGRWLFAIGWLLVIGASLFSRPEGDFLLTPDVPAYVLLAFGMVLFGWALIRSVLPGRGARA